MHRIRGDAKHHSNAKTTDDVVHTNRFPRRLYVRRATVCQTKRYERPGYPDGLAFLRSLCLL
jgi:hypothetical protein